MTADRFGDVLITLGTGKLTEKEEKNTGLVSEHDFAVLRLREYNGRKMLLVKNPWSEGNGWVTTDHHSDMENATEHGRANDGLVELSPSVSKTMADKQALEPGNFWMNLNDIFQHFESMYLNWNPELFSHREDVHFTWDLADSNGRWASFGNNPQFEISSTAGGIVWLVLNRHFKTIHREDIELSKGQLDADLAENGFISLYVFRNSGHKICLTDGAIVRGPYVDSPNTLVKLDTERAQSYIVVVSGQELSQSSHSFTLTGFSRDPLRVVKASDRYPNCITRRGAWTALTAGGNASSSSYAQNPQFRIQLHQQSGVSLLLEVESGDLPVHVKLVRASRESVAFVSTRDVIGDSGEYRKGHAYAEIPDVPADTYSIICSTFEQGQLGRFTLQVGTITDCTVERILAAPAGRFISHAPRAFFRPGIDRLRAQYRCGRLTRVTLIARSYEDKNGSTSKGTSVPLKISLEHGQGRMRQVLAVSGNDEFTNGHYGIQVDDVDLQPWMFDRGCVWITLERAGPSDLQSLEAVDVEVFSDAPGETGMWYEDS